MKRQRRTALVNTIFLACLACVTGCANNPSDNSLNHGLGRLAETMERARVGSEVFDSPEYQKERNKRLKEQEEARMEKVRKDIKRSEKKVITITMPEH